MLDNTDRKILRELQKDARLSMRQLAARVHLSAPAVGGRVQRLEGLGIIRGYSVQLDEKQIAAGITAFVNVIMKSAAHASFLRFAEGEPAIREIHRLSGDSCYLLRVNLPDHPALERLLDNVLEHGNYRVNIAVSSSRRPVGELSSTD